MATGNYILGNELFVYDGTNPIAYATDATLSVSSDTIDCGNKQLGFWAAALPGTISWTMSTSALFTDANNYDALFKKLTSREPVEFKFGYVTSLGDSTTEADLTLNTAKSYYSGTGYITSLELSAGNNEVASFSIEISGNGKLTLTEGA